MIAEHRLAWLQGDYRPISTFPMVRSSGKTAAQMQALPGKNVNLWVAGDHRRKVDTACTCKTGAESMLSALRLSCRRKKTGFFRAEIFIRTNHCFEWEKWRRKTSLAMVLTGLGNRAGNPNRGKRLAAGKAPQSRMVQLQRYWARNFYNVWKNNCCFIQTTLGTFDGSQNVLKKLGLYAYRTHPAALSGGQKQRLSIACGILSDRILISTNQA